ncbi:MAG TPA: hypothetical protein VGL99_09130 [Chloroflexota bacterium]|jgi:hypothetical protein
MHSIARMTLGLTLAGLVSLPTAAFAQMAPTTLVQRTPNYTLILNVGPVESMVSPMDAMHGMAGEVAVSGPGASMMSDMMDQGMAANHHLEVRITQGDSTMVVADVTPTIRLIDKATGESRDLPHVMGMYGSTMGPTDFHYGQNLWLPEGTYLVSVLVGPDDTALFRDVVVEASPMMMMGDQGMMTEHDMHMGAP